MTPFSNRRKYSQVPGMSTYSQTLFGVSSFLPQNTYFQPKFYHKPLLMAYLMVPLVICSPSLQVIIPVFCDTGEFLVVRGLWVKCMQLSFDTRSFQLPQIFFTP